ncbi:MAG: sulfur oxidation c-type cytochrome SoxA [Gammaproteobacteria bacterium]|nr:sulfur oxidation c-type cytochrome SoxA [Gammaproteobacteria bacterium]
MKKLFGITLVSAALLAGGAVQASPEADREAFANFFQKRFPSTPADDFINGVYSIDATSREQWEQIEEFPPYELAVEAGQALWETPFANGKSYTDCFGDDVTEVRGKYPMFDTERKEVVTLELAINECREANGEKPLKWKKGPIAELSSYLAYEGRGKPINVEIPNADAEAAFNAGQALYYTRKGQLNMACATCHMYGSGQKVRTEILSPSFGHTSGFPVYRSKWGEVGTLHRRLAGCIQSVRGYPPAAQSEELRNLEYFLAYTGNGLEVNGPSARK